MKYYKPLLFIVVFVLLSVAAALAGPVGGNIYNFPNVNPVGFTQYAQFQMLQGWENDQLVWYIATDASDLQIARDIRPKGEFCEGLNYAPRLVEMADEGEAATLYIIANLNQGPVFTAVPGDPTYSGVWRIVYVTYKPGVAKHIVKNADLYDPNTNPTGLPSATDATFTDLNRSGLPIVVKLPIMAVGQLDGPWYPTVPGRYRIPQAKVYTNYAYTKIIWLPFWQEYCQDPITKKVSIRRFIVPDVFDPEELPLADKLAPKLGANVAPGLGLAEDTDLQPFYWQQGIQPLSQFPIVHACPMPLNWGFDGKGSYDNNFIFDYTPVQQVIVLYRNVPPLPASTIINNELLLLNMLSNGRLSLIRDTQVIDAPILPSVTKAPAP